MEVRGPLPGLVPPQILPACTLCSPHKPSSNKLLTSLRQHVYVKHHLCTAANYEKHVEWQWAQLTMYRTTLGHPRFWVIHQSWNSDANRQTNLEPIQVDSIATVPIEAPLTPKSRLFDLFNWVQPLGHLRESLGDELAVFALALLAMSVQPLLMGSCSKILTRVRFAKQPSRAIFASC
jgi:hypothetical protein